MKIRPYFRNGRFYNHDKDSIATRINGMLKVVLRMMKKRISAKLSGKYTSFELKEWVCNKNLIINSQNPVITWIGHSTFLIQIGKINILTDPVFGEISRFVPRLINNPISLNKLPRIDIVLISHDHMDHFDVKSLRLIQKDDPIILLPAGAKRLLKGFYLGKTFEMNWWENKGFNFVGLENLRISFLPAAHWSGRSLFSSNRALWGSWMIEYNGLKIYFAGDTAYEDHFKSIKYYYSSIDIALIPIGPENPRLLMDDAHTGSYQAVRAFLDLDAKNFIPMHWGTFNLGLDDFFDPINVLKSSWDNSLDSLKGKRLCIMKFGESKEFVI
jgi:L-ascorbate metabolism protein UlaG (beta-lactamase superfamily)